MVQSSRWLLFFQGLKFAGQFILLLRSIRASFFVVYLLLSINWSFELCYFSMNKSNYCSTFPSHIADLFAAKCLLVGCVVSPYVI